ncbi:MAG: hypothetical protein RIS76_2614, partial [Verrucomicrobiota bacterium]
MTVDETSVVLMRRVKLWRRVGFWGLVAGLAIGGAIWLKPRLRQAAVIRDSLAATSVDDDVLRDGGAAVTATMIRQFWDTQRLPHRRAAWAALIGGTEFHLAALRSKLLSEAARDPDYEVRIRALGTLDSLESPESLAAVTTQLADPDPELRQLGLQLLRRRGGLAHVPLVLPCLADADPTVALNADATLRAWTGRDSGLRLSRLLPARHELFAELTPAADLLAIRAAAEGWNRWWSETPRSTESVTTWPSLADPITLPCPEIRLPDLKGREVDVRQFSGKRVLLNFWTTWCPACLLELPILVELQRRHPDDLVVIGISLDGAESEEGGEPSDEAGIRQRVRAAVSRHRLNYQVLLDPKNTVGRQFNGGELPTQVLLDRDGRVRRRFVGERSLRVWESLLADASPIARHDSTPPVVPLTARGELPVQVMDEGEVVALEVAHGATHAGEAFAETKVVG